MRPGHNDPVTRRRRSGDGRRAETFADIVAEVTATPPRTPRVFAGFHDGYFGDPDGNAYRLVDDQLSPRDAQYFARDGARVVHDPCGCGGYCGLDWLSVRDVERLAVADPPVLRRRKHGLATLSLWQGAGGRSLIVAEGEVYWGDRLA